MKTSDKQKEEQRRVMSKKKDWRLVISRKKNGDEW